MPENNVLVAHFPRSAMGYAQNAVDEFVRQIGERLEEMQSRLDQLTEQNEALEIRATVAQRETEGGGQREAALANAMLAIEQRKLTVDLEIEAIKDQARREAEAMKDSIKRETEGAKEAARREADSLRASAQTESGQILAQARNTAEQMIEEAVSVAAEEEARLQILTAKYDNTIAEMRRLLEAQLALLPQPGALGKAEKAHPKVTPNFAGPPFGSPEPSVEAAVEELVAA
jgi:cell division septum initiation protein DivIVA